MRYLFIVFILTGLTLQAQTKKVHSYYEDAGSHQRSRNIDVTHMLLDVRFEPENKKVIGEVTHTFTTKQNDVDTIFLDGIDISIEEAFIDGLSVNYKQVKGGVVFYPRLEEMYNTLHKLRISYEATPKKGIYFIGWNQPPSKDLVHETRRQIWTQGQGIDHRHWIPMVDDRADKFITEVRVTFDSSYRVLSNGRLIEKNGNTDQTHWHYKINNPHSGYLLMLAIDKYAVKKGRTKGGVETEFWYYPEHPEKVEPSSRYTEEIIDFLEKETGYKYAWGKYSQAMVQDFMYGAMENTSATIFGDFFWVDERAYLDRNYVMVNCHEATHQWFGDLITARNDGDHWLQESFATYYPGIFESEIGTKSDMYWYFRGRMNSALEAGLKDDLPVAHSEGGTARHYPKGASVLYMMQHVMGRTNFNRGINLYLNRNAFKGVETHDLQRAMIDATGLNMDWFLDQWVYRGGEPTYKVELIEDERQVQMQIEQTQEMRETVGLFRMPIDLAVYYANGSVDRRTVMIDKAIQKVTFDKGDKGPVSFALFDEGSFLLKKVSFKKTVDQHLAQLKNAAFVMDRYDAVLGLKEVTLRMKKEALENAYKVESFDQLKAEIAKQLAKDDAWAKKLVDAKEVEVRRALVNTLSAEEKNNEIFLKLLKDSSYSIIAKAMDKLALSAYKDTFAIMDAVKNTTGHTHNIKIKYLALNALGNQPENQINRNLIADFAGPSYEFRTRINAFKAIKSLKLSDDLIVANLIEALTSFNRRLAGPALSTLKGLSGNLDQIKKEVAKLPASEKLKIEMLLKSAKIL
jgi:aminopeptidase N